MAGGKDEENPFRKEVSRCNAGWQSAITETLKAKSCFSLAIFLILSAIFRNLLANGFSDLSYVL
jgi:hypothetical protein